MDIYTYTILRLLPQVYSHHSEYDIKSPSGHFLYVFDSEWWTVLFDWLFIILILYLGIRLFPGLSVYTVIKAQTAKQQNWVPPPLSLVRHMPSSCLLPSSLVCLCYLWSSAAFWLLFRTILHRSEDTSFFWSLTRLMSGNCNSQTLLSDRLNSWNETKTFWSSSQYSKLQGTYRKTEKKPENLSYKLETMGSEMAQRSFRGHRFNLQHQHGGSQLSLTPDPGDLTPSFDLWGHTHVHDA